MNTEKYHYDAIVIGSGISGGWAVKELTEKGLKVLLLERGHNIEHIKDYKNALVETWDLPHRNMPTQEMIAERKVVFNENRLTESNSEFWVNELESPYIEKKRFDWLRAYQVGGRSLTWGRQTYRFNKLDFMANMLDGVAVDWPIRYEDLAPWYDYVERFAGISGNADGLDVLPDGQFLPAMELNVVEKDVAIRIKAAYKGERHLICGRVANITVPKPEQNRVNCQYRNKCYLGCPFGAYFSTQSATLPAALKTGNLTVRPYSIVTKLLYNKDKKRATGVEVLDSQTNQTYEFTSKIIFLNASTFNSTWILMNTANDVWPNGLGSSSGELGHNVMDHHMKVGAIGELEGYVDKYTFGRRPTGFYIPRFRNWGNDKREYLRGFGYQGAANRSGWNRNISEATIGTQLKQQLIEPGPWRIMMGGFGEMLPYHANKVTLDKSKTDKWGLPVLAFDVELKENELLMRKDMQQDAIEMLTATGFQSVRGFNSDFTPGAAIHEMGTARMGRDPKSSVLNANNQVWDALNVFVTDGACMTSSSCVNPSLTYMALTARAAHFAVTQLKSGLL